MVGLLFLCPPRILLDRSLLHNLSMIVVIVIAPNVLLFVDPPMLWHALYYSFRSCPLGMYYMRFGCLSSLPAYAAGRAVLVEFSANKWCQVACQHETKHTNQLYSDGMRY